MESKSRLKQRLARLFHSSVFLRSPCNYSAATSSSSIFSSSAAGSASSRRSIPTDVAVEPVFLSRDADGKVDRSLSTPGRLDCGGCRPTRTSPEGDLFKKKKKKERRVRENGGLYETGGAEGTTCPPVSPSSPKKKKKKNDSLYYSHCFEGNKTTSTTKKKKKKLLSNGYGFSSSSSDEGFEFSSEGEQRNINAGEETETFFSSRSFSSDSSEFYSNSKKKKKKKKYYTNKEDEQKKEEKAEEECGIPVTKRSKDPYVDFRDSMVEMIVERQIFDTKGLEKLLHSFLSLNSAHHHPAILWAFTDIFQVLFGHCSS